MPSKEPVNASKKKPSGKSTVDKPSPEGTRIPTAMLPKELYADIVRLAAYNKIKKAGPKNDSAILREAIGALLHHLRFSSENLDILTTPKPSYIKALANVHQKAELEGGIRKTFSISVADFEEIDALASYNKFHGLLPKNISQVCRDALTFYIENIDYTFRPE